MVWLAAGAVGGPYFGRISEVSSNDQASFLPATAEATEVSELIPEFSESDDIPAIVVFDARRRPHRGRPRPGRVNSPTCLTSVDGVGEASPAIESDDGEALQVFVPISGDVDETVVELRSVLEDAAPAGLEVWITGPAGFTADLVGAFAGIDGLLLVVALAAVFVILLIVYRSPLLPVLVLGTSVFSLCLAILAVWWLAKADIVQINGQVQGILFILVIGAATDYALLYVSRYREALRDSERRWDATWTALRGSVEPIVASGGTVIVGLLCLLLSDLNSNKALGPVAAIGIVCALLGASRCCPPCFSPSGGPRSGRCARSSARPTRRSPATTLAASGHASAAWSRAHARPVWIISTLVLLAAAGGMPAAACRRGRAERARAGREPSARRQQVCSVSTSPAAREAPRSSSATRTG